MTMTLKIKAKTGPIPAKKSKAKRVPKTGATDMVRKLMRGECDYIQTQPIQDPKERQLARAKFNTAAYQIGGKVSTRTTKDNRIVAFIKDGAA